MENIIYQRSYGSIFPLFGGIIFSLVIIFPENIPSLIKVLIHTSILFTTIIPSLKELINKRFKLSTASILFLPAFILISNTFLNGNNILIENSIQSAFNVIIIFLILHTKHLINRKNKLYLKNFAFFLLGFCPSSLVFIALNLITLAVWPY